MARRGHVVNPGPDDPSLLYLQSRHCFEFIWAGRVSNSYLLFHDRSIDIH